MTRLLLAALLLAAPGFAFAQNAGGIPADVLRIVTPITVGDCLQVSKNTVPYAAADAGAPCGTGGGGGTSFQVNGTATGASNPINFLNSAATDGLTLTFANPSAGDVQLGLTGTLSTAGGGTGLSALTEYSLLSGGATTANLIAPSATVGEALISNGTAAQPSYSASLAGVTSVNGTSIPAAATLLYSGGPLGTPSAGTLTNATGLPLAGLTGLGTGVSTALGVATGTAGSFVVNGGAAGTPSAINLTNAAALSLPVSAINATGTPSSTTVLYGNGTWATPTGSGTVNSGTAGTLAGYTATGTAVSPITLPNGWSFSSGALVNGENARYVTTGTTDSITSTDCGGFVGYDDASAVAASLPAASATLNCQIDLTNYGAGAVTVTVASGTIGPSATSLVLNQNASCTLNSAPSGTRWDNIDCPAIYSSGSGVASLASGTQALGTAAIASGACATTIQVVVTGGTTSDTANVTYETDPQAVTGYTASASGSLFVNAFMTAGDLNIEVCNPTAVSITPGAMSLHYSVTSP